MKTYNKRILLSVTGMSPAVVTETLYALVTEKQFIPTEIRVITTLQGKNKLMEALLGVVSGRKERKGALAEFIEDYGEKYGFSHIHFDESCIEVIEDASGQKLSDIRTPEDNELASDQIVKLVGKLCQDDDAAVHVSIAGGRKTMGFFLGYALSLYGREQDSLSHILVVSEQFENVRDFFYPKPSPHFINDKGRELDCSQGQVVLAEIPWVRLGLGISEDLLNQKISYSDSVHKAQQILQAPKITFLAPIDDRRVQFGDVEIKLSPRGYTLLLCLVIAKIKGQKFGYGYLDSYSRPLYEKVYEYLMAKSINLEDDDPKTDPKDSTLKRVLSESRNDIVEKVRKAFSLGKDAKTPYIPTSSNYCYELLVDLAQIDITPIQRENAVIASLISV